MTLQQQQKAQISNTILVSNILLKLLSEVPDSSAVQLKEHILEYQRSIITTLPPPTQHWVNKQLNYFTSFELFKNLMLLAVKLNDKGQQDISRVALNLLQQIVNYKTISKKLRVGKYTALLELVLEELKADYRNLPGKFSYVEESHTIVIILSPLNVSNELNNDIATPSLEPINGASA
ncbi:MAG: hypothetical protein EKK63_02550 [Acinetobacter sp.]|uniref:hypothetical protein n=1 Tax=Acinetobacter sp. TaxID=472 RepID=UPI000FA96558|nr:hypothetical protein [Acinetobacter sp.]RUP42197.1 MAG: hypothetical protein EKK63_02550 [Acinetobacter sp.]